MAEYHPLDVRHKDNQARRSGKKVEAGVNFSNRPRTETEAQPEFDEHHSEGPWGGGEKVSTSTSHDTQFHGNDATPPVIHKSLKSPTAPNSPLKILFRNIIPIIFILIILRNFF